MLVKKHFLILFILSLLSLYSFSQNKSSIDPSHALKHLKFYPNPASTYINFDFQNGYRNNYALLIFNFMGKKVFEYKNIPNHTPINLERCYRGIYIYQLIDEIGRVIESGKFQVVK